MRHDVLRLLDQGWSVEAIADQLDVELSYVLWVRWQDRLPYRDDESEED